MACYCREHHRLKTFHGGLGGWRDEQLPDGTIVWTSPTGRVYKTTPDGYDLFPQLREAVGHRHRASAADPKSRLSGLLVPAVSCASSAQSISKPGGSTTHAIGKSNCVDGATNHAGCSSCSKANSKVPVPGVPGSTTRSNPKNCHPTGSHHPHHHTPSTTTHLSKDGNENSCGN